MSPASTPVGPSGPVCEPLVSPPYRIAPADAHNYGSRAAMAIDMIVIHTTECPLDLAAEVFANPHNARSAHWGIGQDGGLVRFVEETECAWHAGNLAVNHRSIGIELEGHCEDPGMFTQPMLSTLVQLLAYEVQKHHVPVDRQHIIGHREVPDPNHAGLFGGLHHHTDPGLHFPWDRIIHDVGELVA